MARSNSSSRKTSTTTRKTTTADETPENGPQTPDEQPGAESPANEATNAADGAPDPSGDPSGDENTTTDPATGDTDGDKQENEGDKDEQPEEEKEDAPEPEKKVSLNSADAKFTTDQYGNALTPAVPNRATSTTAYFPFEYEEGEEKDTIVAKERVHSVMKFFGTDRKGRAFAYPKGTLLNKAILDAVDHDA